MPPSATIPLAVFLRPPSLPCMLSATGGQWMLEMVGLSMGEKQFIHDGIAQDLRSDGCKRLHFRPISVETGVIPQANGSARVRLGAMDVIVSIKAELGKLGSLQPDRGKVAIFIDCSPTAAPEFEGRGGEELYIDGLVVSSDGNLVDALAAVIKVALSNTGIPKVHVDLGASPDDQPEVDVSDEEFLQFDTSGVPVVVTLTKVGKHYIVDATPEEESQMSSAMSVSVNRHGHICMWIDQAWGSRLGPECHS